MLFDYTRLLIIISMPDFTGNTFPAAPDIRLGGMPGTGTPIAWLEPLRTLIPGVIPYALMNCLMAGTDQLIDNLASLAKLGVPVLWAAVVYRQKSRRIQTPQDAVGIGDARDRAGFGALSRGPNQVVKRVGISRGGYQASSVRAPSNPFAAMFGQLRQGKSGPIFQKILHVHEIALNYVDHTKNH